jgi:hypothetical protein
MASPARGDTDPEVVDADEDEEEPRAELVGDCPGDEKLYRVGPNCETWPNTLTENLY